MIPPRSRLQPAIARPAVKAAASAVSRLPPAAMTSAAAAASTAPTAAIATAMAILSNPAGVAPESTAATTGGQAKKATRTATGCHGDRHAAARRKPEEVDPAADAQSRRRADSPCGPGPSVAAGTAQQAIQHAASAA